MTGSGSRVLVTGAAGRLGGVVASRFHEAGYDVLATDIVAATDTSYPFERADLLDHERASCLLEGVDTVLHIGNIPGIGSLPPSVVFNHNVSINENVFQGAAERGVKSIVFASTLQLIGSHVDERTVVTPPATPAYPMDGSTHPDPSNVYALSKTVSEVMLRYYADRCGIDAVALRFPLLHDGRDWFRVSSGDETATDVLEGFTALSYDDAARLVLAVVESELTGYHVFMPGAAVRHRDLTVPDLVRAYYPGAPATAADLIDNSVITAATGWRPTPDPGRSPDRAR